MIVLESVRRHLKIVGCLPIYKWNLPIWCNHVYIGLIFLLLILYLVLTSCFFTFDTKTFIDLWETTFWTSRSVLSLILYYEFIRNRKELIQFIDDLKAIVNERRKKTHVLFEIYDQINKTSKLMPKYIAIFLFRIAPIAYVLPIVVNSYYKYYNFNYSSESFQLFYPTALPFNWKTPIGYTFAVAFQLLTFLGVLELFLAFIAIYIGICQYAMAFADDIEENIQDLNNDVEYCNRNCAAPKQTEIRKKLRDIVAFHSRSVQFVSKFSTFYKKFTSIFFIITSFYLCIFFLRLQTDIYAWDFLNILRSIVRIVGWIVGFFFICRFGDQVTIRFQNIGKSLEKHQETLDFSDECSAMIKMAQKPIHLYGCFNVRCIEANFRMMMYMAFSSFIVMKAIIR
ncbi:uncharacterized protein LOC116347428 isoform X2 [Contarinia nasturtii]|uniref:uncharacterized protein LOC116347428 isoform X2 n=1 Tax=Contarinia nasturtii TaxID=265458 RepID=UPI0012D42C6F|nr:uncharacterized protein LOC116347428 isoform X2 [Contarinia nasturtii]